MLIAAALAALAVAAPAVHGQEKFPSRPIELIVPTPPGGGVDIIARLLGELAEPILGVKVVVVNKPGGTGAVGVAQLTQAKPDGYTLAVVWNAPLTVTPHTLAVSYSLDDYTPITQVTGGTPFVFCVKPEFPAANGKEFVEALRKNPGKYTYGTDGAGGTVQLAGERAFGKLGVSARAIPFGGAGETLKNFLGGHVDIYGGTIPTIIEYVRAGQAKCLLVTAPERTPVLPDTTSLSELGIGDTASELWRGIIGPKGMPADRVAALQQAFRQATQQRKFVEFEQSRGESAVGGTPADFAKIIKAEYEANAEILKRLGLAKK
jgi:tripartite-type tricarboxylate transporter receptor subunit TctC